MKVFTRDYRINHNYSPLYGEYYNGMKPCVLDIEATGLDPSRCKVAMMGLLTETESGVRIIQFLAENHYEEYKVLQATVDFLREENIDYLITFNGIRYDIPFINTRLEKCFLDDRIEMYDFDLYRFLRKCSNLPKRMDSLSQSSCEKFFGISSNRKDVITGKENVALFDEYSLTGNSTIEKIILTHNREDVYQLYQLMQLASKNNYSDILDTNFHTAIAKYGFPVNNGRFSVRPEIIKSKKIIKICGDQNYDLFSSAYFPDIDRPIYADFRSTTRSLEIQVPVESYNNQFYVKLKDLGLEDEFSNYEECINKHLILNSKTTNQLAKLIVEKYAK